MSEIKVFIIIPKGNHSWMTVKFKRLHLFQIKQIPGGKARVK